MEELIEFYLGTLRAVLIGEGIPTEIVREVDALICDGNGDAGSLLQAAFEKMPGGRTPPRAGLVAMVEMLAQCTPRLRGDKIARNELEGAAATLGELSSIAEEFGNAAMAYNFIETSYHLLDICDAPALDVTRRLRRLSNPSSIPQFHGAIWRLAAEELRNTIDHGSGWLAALDAVDLALTCHVPHPPLQQKLFEKLHTQVRRAQDTEIGELVLQVYFETPPGTSAHAVRERALAALVEAKVGPIPEGTPPSVIEGAAAPLVQTEIGDLRLKFLPQRQGGPQIDLIDLRYRDDRLAHAVPVGRSLIADPLRTDTLLLDMAHEVGHAVVLQGAIGSREALYRDVATYCEVMLVGLADPDRTDLPLDRLKALTDLPKATNACAFADLQLAAVEKRAVERAVWRSWLEGVSLYIELLCDPKDDPNEISLVHECIRGLIDFSIPRRPSEDDEAFHKRYVAEIVEQFDNFMSAAIKKRSRTNHLGYAHNVSAGEQARDVYILGYLVVRSVVSAWESTLGRHLPAGIAVKLLLNATQAGTHDALPDPLAAPSDHFRDAQERYLSWVVGLSSLDKESLEDFFMPVEMAKRGFPTLWRGGRPHRVLVIDDAIRDLQDKASETADRQALVLAGIDPDAADEQIRDQQSILRKLFAQQHERNGFLPIGSDRPRLMFLQNEDRACLGIRTYGGNEVKAAAHRAQGRITDTYDARYHIRIMPLEGGHALGGARLRRRSPSLSPIGAAHC